MFRTAAIGFLVTVVGVVATGVVGAVEFPESADQPSAFVTVYRASDYDDRFETVEDLLHRAPGVRVRRYGGLGSHSTASIRGSRPEQVLVLLDGVRINSSRDGAADLSSIPLRSVDRIEIVRGGGSARHGSQAVGGVVSITSRRAVEDGTRLDAALTLGRYETLAADLAVDHTSDELRVSGTYARMRSENDFKFERTLTRTTATDLPCQNTRGCAGGSEIEAASIEHTRKNAWFASDNATLRFERDVGRASRLFGTLSFHQKQNGQPGNVFGAPLGAADSVVNAITTREDRQRGIARLGFGGERYGGGGFEVALFHRFERSELNDADGRSGLVVPALVGTDTIDWTENATGATARFASRRRAVGPAVLASRASLEYRRTGVRGHLVENRHRTVTSGYFQQEIAFFSNRVRLFPAIGVESATSSDGTTRNQDQAFDTVETEGGVEWLPRFGVIWEIAPGLRAKANYLRSYRRPTFDELFHPDLGFARGNPALRAEEAVSADFGLEWGVDNRGPFDRIRGQATSFRRDLDDAIEWVLTGDNVQQPRNTGPGRVRGYEFQLELALWGVLDVGASYTKTRSVLRANGQPLPNRPFDQLTVDAAWDFGPGRVWADWVWEDRFTLSETGSIAAPKSGQLDAGVVLRLDVFGDVGSTLRDLTLAFEVANLTQSQRVDVRGLPLPNERVWMLTLRGRTP